MSEAKEIKTPVKKEISPTQKSLKWQRDKDREKVKGIFRFYEVPGGSMSFSIKLYKEDKVERYDLFDGEVYEIPLGVAKHLNKNGWYPEYGFISGEEGTRTGFGASMGKTAPNHMRVMKKIRRFGFQSLEFLDIDELSTPSQTELVTVEAIL